MKTGIGYLLFCFAFCLSCPGKVKPELEVGFTFWEMRVLVENPKPDKSRRTGFTREMVEKTVRMKLAEKGSRLVDTAPSGSYLYVNVNQLAASYNVDVRLKKFSEHYGISAEKGVGSVFVPGVQSHYSAVGKFSVPDYNAALRDLERILDSFLFDFLETNLKYESTMKDKKLRGVDLVIFDAIKMEAKDTKEGTAFWPNRDSHTHWWLRYYKLTGKQPRSHPTAGLLDLDLRLNAALEVLGDELLLPQIEKP